MNGNVQRKQQGIKMSICGVAAFYLFFFPCHYYCLAIRKGTGKIMFVTQSTMTTTWPDDQPFKYGKSSNLFHLCRKLPAWPERIFWFVSDEMLEEKAKH